MEWEKKKNGCPAKSDHGIGHCNSPTPGGVRLQNKNITKRTHFSFKMTSANQQLASEPSQTVLKNEPILSRRPVSPKSHEGGSLGEGGLWSNPQFALSVPARSANLFQLLRGIPYHEISKRQRGSRTVDSSGKSCPVASGRA